MGHFILWAFYNRGYVGDWRFISYLRDYQRNNKKFDPRVVAKPNILKSLVFRLRGVARNETLQKRYLSILGKDG